MVHYHTRAGLPDHQDDDDDVVHDEQDGDDYYVVDDEDDDDLQWESRAIAGCLKWRVAQRKRAI